MAPSFAASGSLLFLSLLAVMVLSAAGSREISGTDVIKMPSIASRFFHSGVPVSAADEDDDSVGTRWAILIAGSNEFWNYRHQVITHSLLLLFSSFFKRKKTEKKKEFLRAEFELKYLQL